MHREREAKGRAHERATGLKVACEKLHGGSLAPRSRTLRLEARRRPSAIVECTCASFGARTNAVAEFSGKGRKVTSETLFWELAAELCAEDPRVVEGTIMNGRCLRVGKEFLALSDFKGSGMVVKLPKGRVAELIDQGVGRAFAPAGKVFKEWVAVPVADERRWRALLKEGIAFVGG